MLFINVLRILSECTRALLETLATWLHLEDMRLRYFAILLLFSSLGFADIVEDVRTVGLGCSSAL